MLSNKVVTELIILIVLLISSCWIIYKMWSRLKRGKRFIT